MNSVVPTATGPASECILEAAELIAPQGDPLRMFDGLALLEGNFGSQAYEQRMATLHQLKGVERLARENNPDTQRQIIGIGAGILVQHVAEVTPEPVEPHLFDFYARAIRGYSRNHRSLGVHGILSVSLEAQVDKLLIAGDKDRARWLAAYGREARVGRRFDIGMAFAISAVWNAGARLLSMHRS